MSEIVLIGELLIDMVSKKYEKNLFSAETFIRYSGGSPSNIASNLSDFGFFPILISRVGLDSFGKFLIENLKERGIDTKFIQVDSFHSTSVVFVSKSKENPEFIPARSADYYLEEPENFYEIIAGCSFLHLSTWPMSFEPSRSFILKALKAAEKMQKKICFDPNFREILWDNGKKALPILEEAFKVSFLCKPSEDDAFHIFGKHSVEVYLDKFHKAGVKNLIFTMGKKGAIVSDSKRCEELVPLSRKVVDTTGAGDGFWAGVYAGLLQGKDIFESTKIGNAVAAHRVESVGGSSKLPPLNEIILKYS